MRKVVAMLHGCCVPVHKGGHMGIGAIISIDGKEAYQAQKYVGKHYRNSENVAEYKALDLVLDCLEFMGKDGEMDIVIKTDSAMVYNQMRDSWRIKAGYYVDIAEKCKKRLKVMNETHFIVFKLVEKEENEKAISLAIRELKEKKIPLIRKSKN